MVFLYDYAGNLTSINPEAFFKWLQTHAGAEKINSGGDYVVVRILGYVYKIKRAPNLGSKEIDCLPLRIETQMTEKFIEALKAIGAYVVSGENHWRIFDVWVGNQCVGRIHVAYRVSPLGA